MRPASPGCTQVSTNWRCASASSAARALGGRCSRTSPPPRGLVAGFCGGQAIEQLSRARVAGPLRGALIEIARLHLHASCFLTDSLGPEVLDQPDGPAVVEAGHVLASNQRNHVAKTPPMFVDERCAMRVLLAGHLLEDARTPSSQSADPARTIGRFSRRPPRTRWRGPGSPVLRGS